MLTGLRRFEYRHVASASYGIESAPCRGTGGSLAIATLRGLLTGRAMASLVADLAQAERADRVAAAVVVFERAVVVASAQEMLAAEQRQLDAGLLRYPRAMVVDPADAAVFDKFGWMIVLGPTSHCRPIFFDVEEATSCTRLIAEGWWAFHCLEEAHSGRPQPLQAAPVVPPAAAVDALVALSKRLGGRRGDRPVASGG